MFGLKVGRMGSGGALPVDPDLAEEWNFASKSLTGSFGTVLASVRSGTTATRVNESGVMEAVAANIPRWDYDPVTLALRGLLCEPARTNTIAQPEDLSDAAWGKTACTVDSNAGLGPDGTLSLDRINVTASANYHGVFDQMTAASNEDYTYSVFMRDDGAGFGWISYASSNHSITMVANLSTGEITDLRSGNTVASAASGIIKSADVEDWGGGLYRLTLGGRIGLANGFLAFGACDSGTPTYTTAGWPIYTAVEGEDVFAGYVQQEIGDSATSYTSGVRNADSIGTTDVGFYAGGGTLVAEFSTPRPATGANAYIASFHNGTATEQASMYVTATGGYGLYAARGGAVHSETQAGSVRANQVHRASFAFDANDYRSHFDGISEVAQDTSGGLPIGITTFSVGRSYTTGVEFSGHIRRISYYNTPKANAFGVSKTIGVVYTGLVVGDSFGNEPGEYPTLLTEDAYSRAVSGDQLVTEIEAQLTAGIAAMPASTNWVVIQGGVNDVIADTAASAMEAPLTSMVTEAKAAGLEVIVLGIAPWDGSVSHTAARQTETDAYNTYLAAQDTIQGFTYIDVFTALEDAADTLAGRYDSGDNVHPSYDGARKIASLVDAAVAAL